MTLDSVNKALYSSDNGVDSYKNLELQPPEVSIFVKYKDAFYGRKLLDIGCGAGRTSHYLRNFTGQYVGVDYSSSMVEFSRQRYSDLRFQVADVRDLSCFRTGEFDFVLFSYNGLDYIDHNDRLLALAEIRRVLKVGGVFVFSAHNRQFNRIKLKPSMQFFLNPVRLLKEAISYYKQLKNRRELKSKEIQTEEYALYNDSGNNFGLITYYIDRHYQEKQLAGAGFELLEMYKLNGQSLLENEDGSESAWIYYVAKRV